MILFFTSEKCTWCDVVKGMLEEELRDFKIETDLYEVDIERHEFIAEAYGVMMVPTLVTGKNSISGLPTETDLRTFILQSFPGACRTGDEPSRYRVLSGMQEMLRTQRLHEEEKIMRTLN
ncbi:MAG: thioredoxin family protein [Candidatus Thorarchaeota archaeon]